MQDYDLADETIEVEVPNVTFGTHLRHCLPSDIVDEYDLRDTIVDLVVTQGDSSFSMTDVKIDSQGRFMTPARKVDLYGIDRDEPIDVFIDRVALRK